MVTTNGFEQAAITKDALRSEDFIPKIIVEPKLMNFDDYSGDSSRLAITAVPS